MWYLATRPGSGGSGFSGGRTSLSGFEYIGAVMNASCPEPHHESAHAEVLHLERCLVPRLALDELGLRLPQDRQATSATKQATTAMGLRLSHARSVSSVRPLADLLVLRAGQTPVPNENRRDTPAELGSEGPVRERLSYLRRDAGGDVQYLRTSSVPTQTLPSAMRTKSGVAPSVLPWRRSSRWYAFPSLITLSTLMTTRPSTRIWCVVYGSGSETW